MCAPCAPLQSVTTVTGTKGRLQEDGALLMETVFCKHSSLGRKLWAGGQQPAHLANPDRVPSPTAFPSLHPSWEGWKTCSRTSWLSLFTLEKYRMRTSSIVTHKVKYAGRAVFILFWLKQADGEHSGHRSEPGQNSRQNKLPLGTTRSANRWAPPALGQPQLLQIYSGHAENHCSD